MQIWELGFLSKISNVIMEVFIDREHDSNFLAAHLSYSLAWDDLNQDFSNYILSYLVIAST